jgi:cytochrome P450
MVYYDPFMPEMYDDPFPVYAELREKSPVHFMERHDSWALSLFEDVWMASQDPATFRSPGPSLDTMATKVGESIDSEAEIGDSSIFGMNPPRHTEIRKRLARHFTPKAVSRFEARIRALARERMAEILPTGRAELISDLGVRMSVQVACLIIGLPVEDGPELAAIVKRFFLRDPDEAEGMTADAQAAALELHAYLVEAARRKRREGFDDGGALSEFGRVEIDGRRYSDEEIGLHGQILVVGGTETLPKVFAGGVLQLFRHPDQRAELIADPSLIPKAFVEIARYEMPTQFLSRTLTRDLELRGQKLRQGQGVLFLYRSANRDEREFPDADRFDIHRRPARILSFGHGTHVCLGQHAARLEAKVMYEELLAAVPDYEVIEEEVVPARSEFVAGYLEMPIRF